MQVQARTLPSVACVTCGTPIEHNPTMMCVNCLRTSVDITKDIPREVTCFQCQASHAWLFPNGEWMDAELESRELMAMCLKAIKGLKTVRLVDASWVWTEPHSKRLKVKLTVQKEVMHGAVLQQELITTFIVRNQQSPAVAELYRSGPWQAVVQVRQKVLHKRTFFYLEQLILKHEAHKFCSSIETSPDGMDFFFGARNRAMRFIDFLNDVIPIRSKASKKLISADQKSNTHNYKFSYMIEIVPICKEDIIVIPQRLAAQLGDTRGLQIVERVCSSIHLVEPTTMLRSQIDSEKFWRHEDKVRILASMKQLTEYMVLSVEPVAQRNVTGRRVVNIKRQGKRTFHQLAEVELAKTADMGVNDEKSHAVTHLGHLLSAGDLVLGYDCDGVNYTGDALDQLPRDFVMPDVVLVRKKYASASKRRQWKLQSLKVTEQEGNSKKASVTAHDADYEEFLQELELDKTLRSQINLFKDVSLKDKSAEMDSSADGAGAGGSTAGGAGGAAGGAADEDDEGLEENPDRVQLEELMDELDLFESVAAQDDEEEDDDL